MLVQAFDHAGAKNSGRTDSAPRHPRLTDIGEFKHFSAEVESGRKARIIRFSASDGNNR